MKARIVLLSMIFLYLGIPVCAEEAITLSGKRVILNDDGTWEYKKVPNQKEVKFRGVPWGDTAEEIKTHLSEQPVSEEKKGLMYEDKVNELGAYCCFNLVNGRFVRGNYVFKEEHANKNAFIWDFENIDELLKEKYKEPAEHRELWLNDLYRDRPQNWGMAISIGHYVVHSRWKIGKVAITHILRGDNYKIIHVLQYSHEDMKIIEESFRKEEEQSKI